MINGVVNVKMCIVGHKLKILLLYMIKLHTLLYSPFLGVV